MVRRTVHTALVIAASVLTAACVTPRSMTKLAPDYSEVVGKRATRASELYVACIQAAIVEKRYDVTADGSASLLRFRCGGEAARNLYEGLGPWSWSHKSEWTTAGRNWRSTQRIEKNLFGSDLCSVSLGGQDFGCDIVLNVGKFLTAEAPPSR